MIRPISESDAWVTNDDGDIIGIQLHGRSEIVDLSNPVNGKVNLLTGGIEIPGVVAGRSSAQIAAAPTADDIALGDSTVFYDIADPTKRYALSSARTSFVLVTDGKVRPYILYLLAVPVILLPSGAVNSSGQFTLTTPLPRTPLGVVKVYVFAGVGLTAGLYDATFSSATVCQLAGSPATTAGAYAGGTAEVTLSTVVVPANGLGSSGSMRVSSLASVLNSATTKTLRGKLAGSLLSGLISSAAAVSGCSFNGIIKNLGLPTSQVASTMTTGTVTPSITSIDTSVDQQFTVTGQLGAATDYFILENCVVEILPGA